MRPSRLHVLLLAPLLVSALVACGDGYPAALRADGRPPTIRVLLGRIGKATRIGTAGGAYHLAGGRAGRSGRGAFEAVCSVAGGQLLVDGRPAGTDRLVLDGDGPLLVDGRRYPGRLVVRRQGERLEAINEVDLETYVAGVVGHELGPGAKPATHRAQAICARTYAIMRLLEEGADDRDWHVYDNTRSQVYGGLDVPREYGITYAQMVEAVRANRGVVLTWHGRPFPAYFASTCGGHTTDAATSRLDPAHAADVLRGVPCPYCAPSEHHASPRWRWTAEVDDKRLAEGLAARGGIAMPVHAVEVAERGRGGWAAQVAVVAGPSKRRKVVPGIEFRSIAGLDSHHIESIVPGRRQGTWIVSGRGWGHGVGMCQVGAIHMGARGATESEILAYYYPQASLTRLY